MFELRPVENGFELRGGQLPESMVFRDIETRPAIHLVGYPPRTLTQVIGAALLRATGGTLQGPFP